jgi:hypothetical protein
VYEVSLTATALGEGDTIIHKPRAGRLAVGGTEKRTGTMQFRVVDPPAPPVPPAGDPPPPPPVDDPPPLSPPPPPAPGPVDAPRAVRARLALSLSALPRRAYSGSNVSYQLVARNVSHDAAVKARVCVRLPGNVQFVRATALARFVGSELCFDRPRLAAGEEVAERLVVHIDVDAHPGTTRAHATAVAANAALVRARARMRVLRRPCRPQHAPVTG